jgi:3-isopropylmalate dehydrogenase
MIATIALLPGDGIGPEVTKAAVAALEKVGRRFGHTFEMAEWPIGGAALRQGRDPLPPETREACLVADAVLLGAVGEPAFDAAPPQRRPEAGLLALRRALGAYANLRPAVVWPGLEGNGSLKPEKVAGVDLFIVRELTGGLYFGEPRGLAPDGASAVNTLRYSREEVARIAEVAFAAARLRRHSVVSVDKANVLETSQLWRSVVIDVSARYQDVKLEHMYVDACAMNLVIDPCRFDVILTENLFGDILSDEAGAVVGSLGLLPSASLGSGPGLFEPVHGSAPTLVGRNIANPIGAIASAAMLLRYSLHAEDEAQAIEAAIGGVLADGYRTHDLAVVGGPAPMSCSEMARVITERIG